MRQMDWFNSKDFEREYDYDGPLGAYCGQQGSGIYLWAPTAEAVRLYFYAAGNGVGAMETHEMQRGPRGVWKFETERSLNGWYYDFDVTVDGKTSRTADPYAKACGVNGNRSMVIDLSDTNPDGWETDTAPAKTPEQVICELHIKDFSWDPAGGFEAGDRGKYSALTRKGTTLRGDGVHPTGLDYLKRLGVTHIQLMPIYDYGSVDEENWEGGYNWGYDPVNYNVPEGSYASDPYRGEVRIRELKEMIAALHREGFRVIMDVVYNHTYVNDSWLWRTVPGYYYRQHADGKPSNGSGCGNDVASERIMCARYIRESALYWVREYHIDGFRFDLMGLLDQEVMESIQNALDEEYGFGEKLVYGEPWRAGDTALQRPIALCDKNSLRFIDGRIGAFCDDTRDAVKGSLMDQNARGFVNGGGISKEKLCHCIGGWVGVHGAAQTPYQTITYLSCHDDWTLWDKLVYTMDEEKQFGGYQPKVLKANRLAAAINFCCQGRPFFLAGEEFGRTKGGIKNSFCSSSEINQLDWERAWKNRELVDYYRGLIALRMQAPGMQDKSAAAERRILWAMGIAPDCVEVCLDNAGEGSKWKQLILLFNGSNDAVEVTLPAGEWQLLVDEESSFRWTEDVIFTEKTEVKETSALILGLR